MNDRPAPLDKLSIVVFDRHYDKVHYALVMAAAAAAIDRPVTLFFTMGACHALKQADANGAPAWRAMPLSTEIGANGGDRDDGFATMNVATFEDLLQSCIQLGVTFMVCEMGLRAEGLEGHPLRGDIPLEEGGVVTFLNDTSKDGTVIFV
ncbi:MAG: DsrE/DsrF/DrsH-like family protein [Rhodospirillales bacterium]|nr:DsrE/DsrF/DrsH-like family protein [Rhodospirillales bacterium]